MLLPFHVRVRRTAQPWDKFVCLVTDCPDEYEASLIRENRDFAASFFFALRIPYALVQVPWFVADDSGSHDTSFASRLRNWNSLEH